MKILVIDDEPDIRKIAKVSLEGVGKHSTVMAATAAEGLALAASEHPDLILMDMLMPGMDGRAALRALRSDPATAAIPVIFMTAKVHRFESSDYASLGAIGVIAKPFQPMSLPDEILKILATRG